MINAHNGKDPTLIIEFNTGILYENQCNGCSCSHKWIEGYIVPIKLKHDKYFNPSYWYDQYGMGKYALSNLSKYKYETKKEQLTFDEIYQILNIGAANQGGLSDLRNWQFWDDFCYFLEDKLKYLDLKVRQDIPSVEAWVYIKTNLGNGVIAWQNCD